MKNKIRATAIAVATMGLIGVTTAAADAHENTVTGTAVCNPTTGTWDVTWTVSNDYRLPVTLSNATRVANQLNGTTIAANGDTTATETAPNGAGILTLTVHGHWSDGFARDDTGSVKVGDDCTPPLPPPPPPPTPPHIVKRHAHVDVNITDKCNCWRDKVTFTWNHHKVRGHVTHPNRTTWVAHVNGKRVGNKQFLLPRRIHGHHGWAKHQRYVVHTTNVKCPCHLTHSCPHGPRHHHCPTDGRLAKPCH